MKENLINEKYENKNNNYYKNIRRKDKDLNQFEKIAELQFKVDYTIKHLNDIIIEIDNIIKSLKV